MSGYCNTVIYTQRTEYSEYVPGPGPLPPLGSLRLRSRWSGGGGAPGPTSLRSQANAVGVVPVAGDRDVRALRRARALDFSAVCKRTSVALTARRTVIGPSNRQKCLRSARGLASV